MAIKSLNVLVYTGTGTTAESVKHCMYTLRRILYPNYAVIPIEENTLLKEPWTATCALFVMPGGADLGYCRVLNGQGNRIITQYVRSGGRYLGFCAGAYYGSGMCEFEVGNKPLEVIGSRELAFFPGTCRGSVFRGFAYHSERGARAARLAVHRDTFPSPSSMPEAAHSYFNGGGIFVDAPSLADKGVEVLASYEGDIDVEAGSGKAAIIYCKVGQGAVALSGAHPEFDPTQLAAQPDVPDYDSLIKTLKADDGPRTQLLKGCLTKLGLEVNSDVASVPSLSALHLTALYSDEAQELVESWDEIISKEGNDVLIRSENDIFKIITGSDIKDAPTEVLAEGDTYIKPLLIHDSGCPDRSDVPSFDFDEFYKRLEFYRKTKDPEAREWGNLLLYGKVVTSTNTMLEKNHKLLSSLPTGFTFTARTQIAGRGRGSNVWVAPPGQLIFSTVINHPHKIAFSRPMVFIQYLAGIATVEAIHGYGDGYDELGIKLKWPNDIYATDPSNPHLPPIKIGGILSNCSFSNGNYQVVLGIGINATNSKPTTSLNALLPPNLESFSLERLLARILTRLETLYKTFCRVGFEGDLESRYYKHWLHDRQVVTLESEAGQRARVIGITMDWGMLKVEELGIADKPTGRIWKLQSDENSFDFWKGLVRAKT